MFSKSRLPRVAVLTGIRRYIYASQGIAATVSNVQALKPAK